MNSAPSSCAIISNEKLSQIQGSEDSSSAANAKAKSTDSPNNTTKSHDGHECLDYSSFSYNYRNHSFT